MYARSKDKAARDSALAALADDGPSGESPRHPDDVGRAKQRGGADGVQLHQFAGVVFVWHILGALRLIQIDEHRRAMRRGVQQVAEFSKSIWPDDLQIVVGLEHTTVAFADVDIEMIG